MTRPSAHRIAVAALALGLLGGTAGTAWSATVALAGDLTLNAKGELSANGDAHGVDTTRQTGQPPLAAPPATQPATGYSQPVTHSTAQGMPRPATVKQQATAGPLATATATAPIVGTLPYRYLARTARSPFTPPEEVRIPEADTDDANLPSLQRHPLGDFTLVGIVWTPKKRVAMVSTPDGKGYSVRVGSRIGTANGKVRRISRDAVIIEEIRTDVFGEAKKYETVLALRPEEAIP